MAGEAKAVQQVVKFTASKSGGLFRGLFGVLFRNLRFSLMGLFIILIIISATLQSVKQNSPEPFVTEVGGRIFAADQYLYSKLINYKETLPVYEPPVVNARFNFWVASGKYYFGVFWYFFQVFETAYILYFFFWVFYKLLSGFDRSEVFKNIFLAALFFVMFIVITNQFFIISDIYLKEDNQEPIIKNLAIGLIPFKGILYAFPKFIVDISDPLTRLSLIQIPNVEITTQPVKNVTNSTFLDLLIINTTNTTNTTG